MNKKEVKRDKELKVRFSYTELALIKRKAKEVGIRATARYIREAALNKEIKIKRLTDDEKELYRIIAGIANNLNQIAKKYNQGDRPFIELLKTLSAAQIVIDKLIENDR